MKLNDLPKALRKMEKDTLRALRLAAHRPGRQDNGLGAMRQAAVKYVRERKAVEVSPRRINQRLKTSITGRTPETFEAKLVPLADPMPMAAYPHKQVAGGVRVEINKGSPKLLKSAFITSVLATSRKGAVTLHEGIFRRKPGWTWRPANNALGRTGLPIEELFTSSIYDVLRDAVAAERVRKAGVEVFRREFTRLMKVGIENIGRKK